MRNPPLGELELAVLKHLWRVGEGDAKSIHGRIGAARRISHNTVQSTLERLYRKSLLTREKVSHAYVYRPAVERQELLASMLGDLLAALSGDRRDLLAAFVDLVERTDDASLDRLEALIARRRREAGDGT